MCWGRVPLWREIKLGKQCVKYLQGELELHKGLEEVSLPEAGKPGWYRAVRSAGGLAVTVLGTGQLQSVWEAMLAPGCCLVHIHRATVAHHQGCFLAASLPAPASSASEPCAEP